MTKRNPVQRWTPEVTVSHGTMQSQIHAAVLAERERCAKIARTMAEALDEEDPETFRAFAMGADIASKIREG